MHNNIGLTAIKRIDEMQLMLKKMVLQRRKTE